ncbi:cytochrome c [Pseudomonas aeruginosa]|uniref:cytochrome c n=1 Tax=Pseudomonas aeruginosa TaxID=287 RepID=UPI00345757BE
MHPTFSRVLLAAALAAAGSPAVATEIQLEQGWNAEQRASWYDASLGSRLLPLAWAQALERPDSEERLFSEDNARRLGFPLRNWQGGELRLPRGFALDQQDDSQFSDTRLRWKARQSSSEPWVGLNCAGCHSTDISYRGSELTVDAGATLANVQAIFDEVLAALRRTSDDGDKFARFAGNVLGSEDSPANRELLKAALVKRAALIDTLLSMSATDLQPGPGRLDATGQSLNRAAINSGARHLQANPTDAPTSFPALWHTLQMDKLQSSGFVPNVKVLDLNGQVFDLGYLAGDIGVVQGDYGDVVSHPLSGLEGYISSIRVDNLTRVEGLIHKLKAPAWPSQLFGAPDSARLAQGKRLYEENCAACHASIGRDDLQTPIKVRQVRLKAHGDDAPIGTDPWTACNSIAQLKTGYVRGKPYLSFVGTGQRGFYGKQAYAVDVLQEVVVQALAARGLSVALGAFQTAALGIFDGQLPPLISPVPDSPDADSVEATAADAPGALLLAENVAAGSDKARRLEQCLAMTSDLMAYKARPLNGIWASPPYLHNGSVATLYDLLLPPDLRPRTFYTGSVEFDPVNVGYITDAGGANRFLFDSGKPGNANGGHDYGNAQFNEQQRRALVEYMKTL